jgi:ABC-type amino acid transport substrate-binding protein
VTRLRTLLALAVVALAAVLGACGGDDGDGGGDRPAAVRDLPDSPTIDQVVDQGELRAGVAIAVPWLGRDPRSNEYFGASIRLTKELAKRLGADVRWVPASFDNVIAALQARQIDFIAAPLLETPERLEVIDMTDFTKGGTCYLVKKDNTEIQSTEDLNSPDVTIATFQGTGQATQIPEEYPEAETTSRAQAPGETAPWPEVESDVAPFDSSLAKVNATAHPDARIIPEDCLQNPDLPTPISVGYAKGDEGFGRLVSETVKDIKPQLDADIEKYSDPRYAGQDGG